MMGWSTPKTWAYKEALSSADMNTYVKDNMTALKALISNGTGLSNDAFASTNWTVVWTCDVGDAPVIGNGTLTGVYIRIGKYIFFRFTLTAGTTTTFGSGGGVWHLSLPVAAKAGYIASRSLIGSGLAHDTDTPMDVPCSFYYFTGDKMVIAPMKADGLNVYHAGCTSAVPFTWATTDTLNGFGFYEAA